MGSITIRNLEDDVKRRLRVRAAEHDRSMEEEAREILRQVVMRPTLQRDLGQSVHARFAEVGGRPRAPRKYCRASCATDRPPPPNCRRPSVFEPKTMRMLPSGCSARPWTASSTIVREDRKSW
jgi:antitoxin FitA